MFLYRNKKQTRRLMTEKCPETGKESINWKYSFLSDKERLLAKIDSRGIISQYNIFLLLVRLDILLDKAWFELDFLVTNTYQNIRLKFREIFIWNPEKRKKGYDRRELWNLDMTIITFIRDYLKPRLSDFKNNSSPHSYPSIVDSMEAWQSILEQILEGFDLIVLYGMIDESYNEDKELAEKETLKMKTSIELFSKYWTNLWD